MHSARCGVCIDVGPSTGLPSFRTPVSRWLKTLLSFHCLLRPAKARQLRWCDGTMFDGSLSTHCEQVYGIVNIRMAGHAPQQHVLLEYPGICQLDNTMTSSILDLRLDTSIWKFTAAQHFAYFQRQPRSFGVSHQHCTLHGIRGGGATDHWLQFRDLPLLRRGGRQPLKEPLKDTFKKARSYFTKTVLSPRKLRSRRSRASILCSTRLPKAPWSPQPPRKRTKHMLFVVFFETFCFFLRLCELGVFGQTGGPTTFGCSNVVSPISLPLGPRRSREKPGRLET